MHIYVGQNRPSFRARYLFSTGSSPSSSPTPPSLTVHPGAGDSDAAPPLLQGGMHEMPNARIPTAWIAGSMPGMAQGRAVDSHPRPDGSSEQVEEDVEDEDQGSRDGDGDGGDNDDEDEARRMLREEMAAESIHDASLSDDWLCMDNDESYFESSHMRRMGPAASSTWDAVVRLLGMQDPAWWRVVGDGDEDDAERVEEEEEGGGGGDDDDERPCTRAMGLYMKEWRIVKPILMHMGVYAAAMVKANLFYLDDSVTDCIVSIENDVAARFQGLELIVPSKCESSPPQKRARPSRRCKVVRALPF